MEVSVVVKSKRLVKTIISPTGIELEKCWCRVCLQFKDPKDFYTSYDRTFDANGYMSICKDCLDNVYEKVLKNENSVERTVLKVCRMVNLAYDERAIEAAKEYVAKQKQAGKDPRFFGIYKIRLMSLQKTKLGESKGEGNVMTFIEPTPEQKRKIADTGFDQQEYYEENWGVGLNEADYKYLEQEFAKWKRTTKCDTQAEEILVRELCYKQNEIRIARIEGRPTDSLVKSLQEIMKNSALTPALQNAASAGKNADTFGNWIRDIEQLEPAEWYKDQEKFRDMDGIEEDRADIKRSIALYITGSRDYTTTELEDINGMNDDEGD